MSTSERERLRALAEAAKTLGPPNLPGHIQAQKALADACSPDVLLALLDALDTAERECKRLDADADFQAHAHDEQRKRAVAAEARAEALTAEREQLIAQITAGRAGERELQAEYAALAAENERLREALDEIARGHWNFGNETSGLTVMGYAKRVLRREPA